MIYLDHHAATPPSPAAVAAMQQAVAAGFGNPASVHAQGRAARRALEGARTALSRAIGAQPADVVLTSGGTEACNLAVLGIVESPRHVVTTEIEHPAIGAAVCELERRGTRVSRLSARGGRAPGPDALAALWTEQTDLVAVQWVNHEVGTVLPIEAYAALCAERGAALVVDGSQALGKLPIDVGAQPLSALALSASKIGGTPGSGALWIERGRSLAPRLLGGAQERGRRAGTPDVIAAVGFAAALDGLSERLASASAVGRRRDRLERALCDLGARVNGADGVRVHTVTNVSVPAWRGDMLVAALDLEGLCASSGAACSSGLGTPSEVLLAMYPEDGPGRAQSALRLSLGPTTTDAEIEQAIAVLRRVVPRAAGRAAGR